MQSLEAYLTDDFHADKRDLQEVEKYAEDALVVFCSKFTERQAWPYQVNQAGQCKWPADPKRPVSQSTTSMILGALIGVLGFTDPIGDPRSTKGQTDFPSIKINKARATNIRKNVGKALKLVLKKTASRNRDTLSDSPTFGKNDPLTHSCLAVVASVAAAIDTSLAKDASKLTTKLKRICRSRFESQRVDPKAMLSPVNGDPQRHAFILLRVVRLAVALDCLDDESIRRCFEYFETTLHDQLSYSSIPDSRFDPAELAFCLEGMLLCQPRIVDLAILNRVFDVLASAQSESAFWRPVKPVLSTKEGLVLFPVSVEVANSLMRSCIVADANRLHDTFASKRLPLFRRYWQWLKARSIRFSIDNEDLLGWHSEHVNDTDVIHLWETSQVIEFLLLYRVTLLRHISVTTLVRSQFRLRSLEQNNFASVKSNKGTPAEPFIGDHEPVTILGKNYFVLKRIEESFLKLASGEPRSRSVLLYGPPGTGKSTIAAKLAGALKTRMITITVSDFLAGGEAQMEARAKHIFDVLECQPECVVLFDEIDNFLLNRDSTRYGHQDTAFQFLTPGMLTKLNDLRQSQRVIFIVATNYAERIDSAIKRPGRIDHHLLLLPPDKKGRQKALERFVASEKLRRPRVDINLAGIGKTQWQRFDQSSLFYSYAEIAGVLRDLKELSFEAIVSELGKREPTIRLQGYTGRFYDSFAQSPGTPVAESDAPLEEFFCLVALYLEVNADNKFKPEFVRVCRAVKNVLPLDNGGKVTSDLVKSHARIGKQPCQRVARFINVHAVSHASQGIDPNKSDVSQQRKGKSSLGTRKGNSGE